MRISIGFSGIVVLAACAAIVSCSASDQSPERQPIGTNGSGNQGRGGTGFGGAAGSVGGASGSGGSGFGGSGTGGVGTGGSGGTAGAGGSGGALGTGGSAGSAGDRPPCESKVSQTVIIGDSYINWGSHTLPADLAREAGETWRLYAIGGSSMATGGIAGFIPDQFEQALMADPNILFVVMDGGGNDILIPAATWVGGADCKNNANSPTVPVCQEIVQAAINRAVTLMDRAASVGVRQVVYFFYPHVPNGTVVGGLNPNAILDYALPRVKATCDGASGRTGGKLTCYFVDMIPVFNGHPEYFAPTDIHPNTAGSAAMAKAIWAAMKTSCVAQKASSGCCTP